MAFGEHEFAVSPARAALAWAIKIRRIDMLEYLLTVDWATAKTAFSALIGAGFGSAMVQRYFAWRGEERRKDAHATYLAMRIAVLLDAHGLACSDLIISNSNAEHFRSFPTGISIFRRCHPIPKILKVGYRLTGRWRAGVYGFAANACLSELDPRYAGIYPEDLGEATDEQAAALGLQAWKLAKDLHHKYRLDASGGGYVPYLQEKEAGIIKARNDRQEAQRSTDTRNRIS